MEMDATAKHGTPNPAYQDDVGLVSFKPLQGAVMGSDADPAPTTVPQVS